jgi:hypothetical protein
MYILAHGIYMVYTWYLHNGIYHLQGRRGLVVKAAGWLSFDIQFKPYLRANTMAPSWRGLGCRSRTLMVEYINPRFFTICNIYWCYRWLALTRTPGVPQQLVVLSDPSGPGLRLRLAGLGSESAIDLKAARRFAEL